MNYFSLIWVNKKMSYFLKTSETKPLKQISHELDWPRCLVFKTSFFGLTLELQGLKRPKTLGANSHQNDFQEDISKSF